MPGWSPKQIAGVAGVALAVLSPFINFQFADEFAADRLEGFREILSMGIKLMLVAVLALLAFGVEKRRLSFFGIRGFGWRDIGAMFIAVFWAVALVFVAMRVLDRFGASGSSETGESAEIPFAIGLASAMVAGISEEFIYRGFLIEELGELLQNRALAGAFSVLAFGLGHYNTSGYGWSIALLYPTLFGLVITVLYFWRSNLLICMLMHVGFDSLSVFSHRI